MTALRSIIVSTLLIAALGGCAGRSSGTTITPPPEVDITVTVEGSVFDSSVITLAAGEVTTLFFENLDGQPHNIAIYTDESATESLFVGELIRDGAITYEIPALEPGAYFFRCDAHPAMTGVVAVDG